MTAMAPRLIQPFPPGMVSTAIPAAAPRPLDRPPAQLPEERTLHDALARARARRLRLIALIAGLGPRSHKRPRLMEQLRQATIEELRLTMERRP